MLPNPRVRVVALTLAATPVLANALALVVEVATEHVQEAAQVVMVAVLEHVATLVEVALRLATFKTSMS